LADARRIALDSPTPLPDEDRADCLRRLVAAAPAWVNERAKTRIAYAWARRCDPPYRVSEVAAALAVKREADHQRVEYLARICTFSTEDVRSATAPPPPPHEADRAITRFSNFYEEEQVYEKGSTQVVKVGYPMQIVRRELLRLTKGWPRRVGSLLFAEAPGPVPLYLQSPTAMFAWVSSFLPPTKMNNLQWIAGYDKVSEAQLYENLRQTAEDYAAVEGYPHWPPLPKHYYMHPPLEGGDGRAFAGLLSRFCPATDLDADLIRAFFLTSIWGGLPGKRPAWLITGEDDDEQKGRGCGKTKLANTVAETVGGAISLSANEDISKLKTRLLSPDALGFRVALLDNIKSLHFSWADLESLVTCDVVSGHRMYSGEGRRPNTLMYVLTLNGANLSKDMAQRVVTIKLRRPPEDALWEEQTLAYIRERRWQIVGDILAELKKPAAKLATHSRWGSWEDAIVARLPRPAAVQRLIRERQGEMDGDDADADTIRAAFAKELSDRGHDPDRASVRIPVGVAAAVVSTALRRHFETGKATTFLKGLHIPELRYDRKTNSRAWVWSGTESDTAKEPEDLNDRPIEPGTETRKRKKSWFDPDPRNWSRANDENEVPA
jgi:hypothetical protein